MVAPITPVELDWQNGLPWSRRSGEAYFSHGDPLAESRSVFLGPGRLAERFRQLGGAGFTVAEIGFACGLNFLTTLALWLQERPAEGWLHFVSLEEQPLTAADMAHVHALWPELRELSEALLQQYPPLVPGFHRLIFTQHRCTLTLLLGDATIMLPRLEAKADAWFLNGFGTDPALWTAELLSELPRLCHANATLAASATTPDICQRLTNIGFAVSTGNHETFVASLAATSETKPDKPWLARSCTTPAGQAAIIGAGIAGASAAHALALRGWQVDVFDSAAGPAGGASGNPAAIIYPKLSPPALADEHFQQQAFLFAQRRFPELAPTGVWNPCGVLWFLAGNQQREGEKLEGHPWPRDLVSIVSAEEASALAGLPVPCPALHFPDSGWLAPQAFCAALLAHPNIHTHFGKTITRLEQTAEGWRLHDSEQVLREGPVVIVANAGSAKVLEVTQELPLGSVRGQISQMQASPASANLKAVLCYGGYLSPAIEGKHCLGASFYPGRTDTEVLAAEHEENRAGLAQYLPELAEGLEPTAQWSGRAAVRCQSPDYLPLVGPLSAHAEFCEQFAGLRQGNTRKLEAAKLQLGLYCQLGFGSKGFTTALLAAEVLAAELNSEPYPVSREMLEALHPNRLWAKQLRRRQR